MCLKDPNFKLIEHNYDVINASGPQNSLHYVWDQRLIISTADIKVNAAIWFHDLY